MKRALSLLCGLAIGVQAYAGSLQNISKPPAPNGRTSIPMRNESTISRTITQIEEQFLSRHSQKFSLDESNYNQLRLIMCDWRKPHEGVIGNTDFLFSRLDKSTLDDYMTKGYITSDQAEAGTNLLKNPIVLYHKGHYDANLKGIFSEATFSIGKNGFNADLESQTKSNNLLAAIVDDINIDNLNRDFRKFFEVPFTESEQKLRDRLNIADYLGILGTLEPTLPVRIFLKSHLDAQKESRSIHWTEMEAKLEILKEMSDQERGYFLLSQPRCVLYDGVNDTFQDYRHAFDKYVLINSAEAGLHFALASGITKAFSSAYRLALPNYFDIVAQTITRRGQLVEVYRRIINGKFSSQFEAKFGVKIADNLYLGHGAHAGSLIYGSRELAMQFSAPDFIASTISHKVRNAAVPNKQIKSGTMYKRIGNGSEASTPVLPNPTKPLLTLQGSSSIDGLVVNQQQNPLAGHEIYVPSRPNSLAPAISKLMVGIVTSAGERVVHPNQSGFGGYGPSDNALNSTNPPGVDMSIGITGYLNDNKSLVIQPGYYGQKTVRSYSPDDCVSLPKIPQGVTLPPADMQILQNGGSLYYCPEGDALLIVPLTNGALPKKP